MEESPINTSPDGTVKQDIQPKKKQSKKKQQPHLPPVSGLFITRGESGLPIFAEWLLPQNDKGNFDKTLITDEHVKKPAVWENFWIVDPHQYASRRTVLSMDVPKHRERFKTCLARVAEDLILASARITELHCASSLGADGFRIKGQRPRTMNHVTDIIKSPYMMDCFKADIKFPFCVSFKHFFSINEESKSGGDAGWMYKALLEWAMDVKRVGGVKFEFKASAADGRKHPIMKLASLGFQNTIKKLQELEYGTFHMTLRTKKQESKSWWILPVDLPYEVNPSSRKTYICVSKAHYSVFRDINGGPTFEQLEAHMQTTALNNIAHMFAVESIRSGLSETEAKSSLSSAWANVSKIVKAQRDSVSNTVHVEQPRSRPIIMSGVANAGARDGSAVDPIGSVEPFVPRFPSIEPFSGDGEVNVSASDVGDWMAFALIDSPTVRGNMNGVGYVCALLVRVHYNSGLVLYMLTYIFA